MRNNILLLASLALNIPLCFGQLRSSQDFALVPSTTLIEGREYNLTLTLHNRTDSSYVIFEFGKSWNGWLSDDSTLGHGERRGFWGPDYKLEPGFNVVLRDSTGDFFECGSVNPFGSLESKIENYKRSRKVLLRHDSLAATIPLFFWKETIPDGEYKMLIYFADGWDFEPFWEKGSFRGKVRTAPIKVILR
jgi:hypothetical protein